MNIEWNKLRPYNGDIKNGFEELVCQLARAEKIKNKSRFIRVAAPDGGVESYWILSDNTEYGWQAKFFTSMSNAQWTQLDESFKTAFEKHLNLVKYFVCTPLDRQDPRITIIRGKNTGKRVNAFMDKWNSKVEEWKSFASKNGRKIEIEYWGNFEIFERLTKKENEGKLYYWFNQEEFSDNWFRDRLNESITNLDKRYTPELNFNLPIAKVFNGIARDNAFQAQLNSQLDDLLKSFNKAVAHVKEPKVRDSVDALSVIINNFRQQYGQIDFIEILPVDTGSLTALLEEATQVADNLIRQFYELDMLLKKQKKDNSEYGAETNNYGWDIEYFREFRSTVYKFTNFLNSVTTRLANNPFLLLTGEAGIGKSHLLADIALKRLEKNQPTILLLGQHFTAEEPWSQVKKLLQMNCERDIFLASLNARGESMGSRILILIDALNEGEGKKIWKNHIAGFITAVRKFAYIGVVFSVRTSYENLLIPQLLQQKNELIKLVHHGFANKEYEASRRFFENFEIKQPAIPLLHPEFSNPLFLKLFCEGLSKKGLHEIPEGYEGISAIINFYLEAINSIISEKHNVPVNLLVVQKLVKSVANQIADTGNTYIKLEDAFALVTQMARAYSVLDPSQFFQDLIFEGLLTQNLYWDDAGNHFDGVYISYERFSDHLVCSYLLDKYLDRQNPADAFSVGTKLYDLLKNSNAAYSHRGIIEALSIQLPELTGLELFELAPHARSFDPLVYAFMDSIIWRKRNTIHDKVKEYINAVILRKRQFSEYFFDTILLVTSQPGHYFNSDFLHQHLVRFSMANRDAWWTQFIHDKYPGSDDYPSPVKRMIDWAWTGDSRQNITQESIRLMCQTMLWLLTSTNRTLRDAATKALICLLEERIDTLIQLLKKFHDVNDPYVVQRLYAVAYGCAVRTGDLASLHNLGNCVFEMVFKTKAVVPDILLRDYARGVIEFAVSKGHTFSFGLDKIRPPFCSTLPKRFPLTKTIKKYEYDYKAPGFKDHYWSLNAIIDSMKTNISGQMYGDFGRYVFETAFRDWRRVNAQALSNLAVKWIIEDYGYDVEKHGKFDRSRKANNYDRHFVMEERIGKKYQWIAFYNLLARVADNCRMYENSYSSRAKPVKYEGPWDPYVRDIDPTIIIKGNPENKRGKFWWYPVQYSNWKIPNKEWVHHTGDLPDPKQMISVFDENGTEWLILEIMCSWDEPPDIGFDKWEHPHKDLWYQVRSYITPGSEYQKLLKWASKQNFMGRWMPEAKSRYQLFSREYFWAPACNKFRREEYSEYCPSDIHDRGTGKFIGKVQVTTADYLWEEQFDASKTSPISFYKPSEPLFNLLGLHYGKIEGQLFDKEGNLVVFDPSAIHPTNSCLVIKKDVLIQKLEENDLKIFWTILGEKRMIGGGFRSDYEGALTISGVGHIENQELNCNLSFKKS